MDFSKKDCEALKTPYFISSVKEFISAVRDYDEVEENQANRAVESPVKVEWKKGCSVGFFFFFLACWCSILELKVSGLGFLFGLRFEADHKEMHSWSRLQEVHFRKLLVLHAGPGHMIFFIVFNQV